jgi:polyphosphate kinase
MANSESEQRDVGLLDRDHSILAFNQRVLAQTSREHVPLLERLRYLCIASSNLDEFFEVRMAPHHAAALADDHSGTYSVESFDSLHQRIHAIVEQQYMLFNDVLTPAFKAHGISIVSHGERTAEQKRWVDEYFRREVRPLLVPIALDPAHPFPRVANKSLHFIVQLKGQDAFNRSNEIAIIKVPRVLPRIVPMPAKICAGRKLFVSLSSIIRAHLQDLFPGRAVGDFSQFRVTRHSDLFIDEDDVKNLRTALRQGLQQRNYGRAVRLEVSASCSAHLADMLLKQFELPAQSLYRVHGPVNLVRFGQLADLVDAPKLRFSPYQPAYPQALSGVASIFERLKQTDVLIHQPFESFDAVLAMLREAVRDPNVLSIRQTIYRTGSDPVMLDLLREAVRGGKEVLVVVELKARFDEEVNINWAEALESIGAQVVYGVVGLKTHAKMLLITRREGKQLRRYGHLSTGNYNPRTARLYTDLSQLTANAQITLDMEHVFNHLTSQSRLPTMQKLLVAPFSLHQHMIDQMAWTARAAKRGKDARIVIKVNALTDEPLIDGLIAAARAGVKIDLIVRGACMLPAGIPDWTHNIRVRSVIGRFLEHSRIFYFRADGQEELLLASADWMSRNMQRRIELAWPIEDQALRQRVIDECLVAYLHDTSDAWNLMADGRYQPITASPALSAQRALMERYGVTVSTSKSRD